jgi:hypothetical protein
MPAARPPTAIGFRVKSGWAVAILLAGPPASPSVVDRQIVELSDPAVPNTRQPYHGGTGKEERDAKKIARRVASVRGYARPSLARLIERYRTAGHRIRGAALVAGSVIEPERIANPHIRAHAFEGQLFRTVVEEGAKRAGLPCATLLERDLFESAAAALDTSIPALKRAAAALGATRSEGGPWRAEEKAAAVAAWVALVLRGS